MILCIGTTPAVQRVMVFHSLALDAVNRAARTLDGAAGKSVNVAKVLRSLGEEPLATGFLGGDRGEFISTILSRQGVAMDFVRVAQRTRECITVIDESHGRQTELVEEASAVTEVEFRQLMQVVGRRIAASTAVILSGTLAPGVPVHFYRDCTRIAAEHSIFAAVDAHGESMTEALKANPDLVKPNRAELAVTVRRELKTEPELLDGLRELGEHGARRVVVTGGAAPTLAYDGTSFWRIHKAPIKVANPIGSGDAFTAATVARLIKGDDLGESCRWGTATAAANALSWMPGDVELDTVRSLLDKVLVERLHV